ncbi:hypothetical protein FQR65_LT08175 [Abscondita terminalis]|nr:hypothetical protein FQR65_LT08175 [Abscondita terminalis]
MKQVLILSFFIVSVIFENYCWADSTSEEDSDEGLDIFSEIFPQVAQHLDDDPIEIIDIIKSVSVFESHDDDSMSSSMSDAEESTSDTAEDASELI